MNTNPVMVYFGQEFGERGMDEEGFSGRDGRTTIFDYWTVDTIRRWRNGGKFDGKLLTDEEKALQAFYTRVLNLCTSEKALAEGTFYDLMYANYDNPRFNSHRQYTFLRKSKKELILVVVNFDEAPAEVGINIPAHAFDFLEIPTKETVKATDLLTGKREDIALSPTLQTTTRVDGFSGKVLKVKL